MSGGRAAADGSNAPVPQRCTIVLPTTGEFDSRTFRIASALAARGHEVTVLARLAPGLPAEARDPAGYRIVRLPVSAADGLPLPAPIRRAVARWRSGRRAAATGAATTDAAATDAAATGVAAAAPSRVASRGRLRRAVAAAVRIAAIALTVRSQARAARAVAPPADVVHGMAYMGIPVALAVAAARGGRVVYDARDIYVDANNLARLPGPARRLLGRVERGWARRADRVMTVNRPYAEVMADRFGVPLPAIVMNCSYRFDPGDPPVRRFHEALGLAAGTRVVLYQGGLAPHRGIEQLVAAIGGVPDAVLVLLGYGPLAGELERIAADPAGPAAGRVRLLPAVPPAELLGWVAAADVVAMPIQPSTLNHRLTTPNKLFEAMAAGVPVVASDLPGMAAIVRETGCGRLVDPTDPAAIAAAIRAILDAPPAERRALRDRALAAAHGPYSWERQMGLLVEEYGRLTGRPW
ncbi:MAG: hypothetical protein RL338_292 [Chloroflexota bacterium]